MSITLYEVVGYHVTCPSEKFSIGLFKTNERANEEIESAHKDYSDCEFEVESKNLYE